MKDIVNVLLGITIFGALFLAEKHSGKQALLAIVIALWAVSWGVARWRESSKSRKLRSPGFGPLFAFYGVMFVCAYFWGLYGALIPVGALLALLLTAILIPGFLDRMQSYIIGAFNRLTKKREAEKE